VWVNAREIARIAAYLGLSDDAFGRRYLRRVKRRISLVEKANKECIFWRDGCQIYEERPTQCRTFPFWKEHLANLGTWEEGTAECPGSGSGRHYSREEIDELKRGRGSACADGSS